MRALCLEQEGIGLRGAERGHTPACEVGEGTETRGIGRPDSQHLPELEVGQTHRQSGTQVGAILEPGHADIKVPPCDRLLDGRPAHLHELCTATESFGHHLGDLHVEAADRLRVGRVRLDKGRTAFRIATPAQGGT